MIKVPLIFCVTLTRKKQKSKRAGVTGKNTQSLFAKDEHSLGGIKKHLFISKNIKSCSGRVGFFCALFFLVFSTPSYLF